MSTDLSKLCADYLRTSYTNQTSGKLKASHARELVAAFFGYKSHAALIAEKDYPLDKLDEAHIFIPDIPLIEARRVKLAELPDDLMPSKVLAEQLSSYMTNEGYCGANIWLYDTLEAYIAEVLLVDCQPMIDDQLSGTMAETNAGFFDAPYYETVKIQDNGDELVASAKSQYKGQPLDDKPFCGDTIDMTVRVILPRLAGKRGFWDFELDAGGIVNDDWIDPELKYGSPIQSNLAEELGVSDQELELLDFEVQENSSNDGLVYDFILTFHENNPREIMEKIEGISDGLTIRVSANAFDEPPDPFDDWVDPAPNVRPKDQFLAMTGGFRFGESPEQFQGRQREIHAIRNRLADGKANADDIGQLSGLLGTEVDDDEPFDVL